MDRYVAEKPKDWISNATGIEPYPKDPQFYPEWPPRVPIGPSASYRRGLSRGLSGCVACGLADTPIPELLNANNATGISPLLWVGLAAGAWWLIAGRK